MGSAGGLGRFFWRVRSISRSRQ